MLLQNTKCIKCTFKPSNKFRNDHMSHSGDKSIFENRYSRKTINRIENSKKKTDFAFEYRIFYIKNTECAKRSFTTYTEFQVGFKLISKTVPAIQLFLKNRLFSSFKLIGVAFLMELHISRLSSYI